MRKGTQSVSYMIDLTMKSMKFTTIQFETLIQQETIINRCADTLLRQQHAFHPNKISYIDMQNKRGYPEINNKHQ